MRKKKYNDAPKPNEIQVYALHLLQDNKLEDCMTEKAKRIFEKNNLLGITAGDPMVDLQILLFYTPEDRNQCYKDLEEMGIKTAIEIMTCYVDKKYLKEGN